MFRCILVVERFDIIRQGICSFLKSTNIAGRVVAAASVREAIRSAKDLNPELVLANPSLVSEGPNKLRQLLNLPPDIPLCAVIHQLSDQLVDGEYDESLSIFENQEYWIERLQQLKLNASTDSDTNSTLTTREKEVLRFLSLGMSNKEVATSLNISVHTAITHRKNIVEKTGIRSLAGLTVYAIINGVVDMKEVK